MKAIIGTFVFLSLMTGTTSLAKSINPYKKIKTVQNKNHVSFLASDTDPGEPPFPPIEELEPIRFGNWKVKISKTTAVYENNEWTFRVEEVCNGSAPVAVYDAGDRESYSMRAPEETIIACQIPYGGSTYGISLIPLIAFSKGTSPFTNEPIRVKSFTSWWWPNDRIPPYDFFKNFQFSSNVYTLDTGLTNVMFSDYGSNFGFCEGSEDGGGKLNGESDLPCDPPENGTTIETFEVDSSLDDPAEGRR